MSYEASGVFTSTIGTCKKCGSSYEHYHHNGKNSGLCVYCQRGCSELNPDSKANVNWRKATSKQ